MDLKTAIKEQREYHEDNYDDDDYNDSDAIQSLMDDCGQMADGTCALAGTKYCDWDCPFSNEL